ncbi:nucleotidyltransferase domain-containing protein [Endozoicomonas sp. SESOKO1]|uniref:nucleotidyltransferase family protein n=1 Tax=Endozoicomonas sp. SESOKO1 TaxID=2828742 RepID=UPI0021475B99
MRISEAMAQSIVELARKHVAENARVWLFGSRADDTKKGGDIDLYIEADNIGNTLERKINFRMAFEDRWGELKVDVLIHDTRHEMLAIHEIARQGVRLC